MRAGGRGVAQTSGWVDEPGDYLNLLTFSETTPAHLRSAWSCKLATVGSGPNSEKRGGSHLSLFPDPKTPVQTCPIISTNKHRFVGSFIYGNRYSSTETVTSSTGKYISIFAPLASISVTTRRYHLGDRVKNRASASNNAKTARPARTRREQGRDHFRKSRARRDEETAHREVDLIARKVRNGSKPGLKSLFRAL